MKISIRPLAAAGLVPQPRPIPQLRPVLAQQLRSYATQPGVGSNSTASKRKAVTPFNDDGYVPWRDLSAPEKASRATQQSFNFGMVILGAVMTAGVGYFLYTDVFSPDSKTAYFNRAVDRIKKDPDCVALLGDSKKIIAHGEETANKWRRARPIASTHKTDGQGNEHLMMHFYLEGPLSNGLVNVHLVKRAGHHDFEYKYFFVDVKGHPRIYLENADAQSSSGDSNKFKLFGVSWS
ncbi:Uu.00g053700.m01.CDS01 [Anthostomella pinea]|uniref:Mitochondrial import inner membrane translocase subunit Tim21 n=1 Tax=Anthostomella pinea TaxID=933095 RepID=A0AAI8VX37_9PEZI|nr:Uu.00g053700.m01.CDS01 [Anthostomella pinea]